MEFRTARDWSPDRPRAVLALVLLVGGVLRGYRIGAESLWFDEVFALRVGRGRSLSSIAFELPLTEPHPPLYYLMLGVWIDLFGTSPVAVRSLSAVASLATLPVVYLLGAELFDERVGVAATTFTAVSAYHVYFAQEARMYALLFLLSGLSMLAFLRLPGDASTRSGALYAVSTVAVALTHIFGLLVVAAQNVVWLANLPRRDRAEYWVPVRAWVGIQALVAVSISPWLYVLARHAATGSPGWLEPPGISQAIEPFGAFLIGVMGDSLVGDGGSVVTLAFTVLLGSLFVAAVGLAFVRPAFTGNLDLAAPPASVDATPVADLVDRGNGESLVVAVVWIGTLTAVPLVISHLVTPIYYYRYVGAASIPVFLLAAKGILSFERRNVRRALLAVAVVGLIVPTATYYGETVKQDWGTVTDDVDRSATSDDLILLSSENAEVAYEVHSDGSAAPRVAVSNPSADATVRAHVEDRDRIYVVGPHSDSDRLERIRNVIEESHEVAETRHETRLRVYVYEPALPD